MITKTRNHRLFKTFVSFVVLNFVLQTIQPSLLLASNGGGAAQPEFNAFTPIESQDLVNLFTGDFKYNIPLLDVGGYPLNLSYNGDIKMDQEASWVGLGWNINVGAITRDLRGIPDEFKGDLIEEEINMKPNITIGVNSDLGTEAFGFGLLDFDSWTIGWNNYDGISTSQSFSTGLQFAAGSSANTAGLGLGITSDRNGLSLSPSISFSSKIVDNENRSIDMGLSVGTTWNNRTGMNSISIDGKISESRNEQSSSSLKASTSFDLVNNTYLPKIDFPRHNFSLTANFKLGADFIGADATGNIQGFFTKQKLATKSLSTPAYGYLFSEITPAYNSTLMDVNLAKDRAFTLNQTNLAVPNFTHDIYQISGQGIGGSFRPMRNDMGYLRDKYTSSSSNGVSLGFELATGGLVHIGSDFTVNTSHSHSGHWQNFNEATNKMKFKEAEIDSPYESYQFKMSDEISPDLEMDDENSISLHSLAGKEYPTQVVLAEAGRFDVKATSDLHPKEQAIITSNIPLFRNENIRVKRNKNISVLSKKEKSKYGITRSVNGHAKDYHPAEFTVLNSDGRRYIYGEAVYNTLKKDVSFNVSGRENTCAISATDYFVDDNNPENSDNSKGNKRGKDHYFNAQTLPPYAHSHLLTAVLSPDYVDSDNSGSPSPADLGDYVFFKYGEAISDFKWRVPYDEDVANFNEGLKTKNDDDRASYIYGEKEVKYLTGIESKNYIAVFHISKREDGFPVKDENGGRNDSETSLKRLDKISLYSRAEFEMNNDDPKPIKEVHFEYSYDLCNGIPSNRSGGGKLTLERVYFTYGFSSKGALSDYEFTYGTGDYNPTYERSSYNVWGGYQEYSVPSCNPTSNGDMPSFEFPFVRQEKPNQDEYAAAWALKSIKTPEGGKIEIDLEADDYAKVQDKDAMQMFKIIAAGNSPSFPEGIEDFLYFPPNNNAPNTYLFFQLPEGFNNESELKRKYFKNLMYGELLYFRFLVDLTAVGDYEYIEGFVEVEDVSINDGYGVIEIKKICKNNQNTSTCINSNKVNPISFAAWNFGLANHPELVNGYAGTIDLPDDNPNEDQMKRVLTELTNPSLIRNITEFLNGKYNVLRGKWYASKFVPNKSWVRLYNPNGKMLGGGSRVKNIRIYDNWGAMTNAPNGYDGTTIYEQHYDYTLNDSGVSSGVASYMPIGCKENPHVQPVFFSEKHRLAPDDKHFMLRPFGEGFFPRPSIGYSKVTVSKSTYSNDQRRAATGKAVHEFYTTKDYPTKTDETRLNALPKKTGLLGKLLKLDVKSNMFTSQGYSIITNDMNGKPKSVRVYGHNQTDYISGVDYIYENDISSSGNFGLKNKYPVILQDGSIKKMSLGVDQDMFTYFSESESYGAIQGLQSNLATFILGIIPGVVPTFFPLTQQQTTQYKTAITTKHIHKRGILKRIIQYDLGANIETENLAWDGETGEVLLTRIINEHGDYYYNLAHPAHWQYEDGMGAAFKNIALELNLSTGTDGVINVITPSVSYLVEGDELYFTDEIDKKYWVIENKINDERKLHIVDKDGIPYSNHSGVAKIIRSGRRNQHLASIGSIQSKINPIDINNDGILEGSLSDFLDSEFDQQVLQAEAIEYNDHWQMLCGTSKQFKGRKDTCYLTDLGNRGLNSLVNTNLALRELPDTICILKHIYDSQGNRIDRNQIVQILSDPIFPNTDLGEYDSFNILVELEDGSQETVSLVFTCPAYRCETVFDVVNRVEGILAGVNINPYVKGIRGNWLPKTTYLYLKDRTQSNYSNYENLDIRKDGIFKSFNPFWNFEEDEDQLDPAWTWTSQLNKAIPSSKQLESKDALERYSAVLYGFNNNFPIATASNATYRQLGYTSFEEIKIANNGNLKDGNYHFRFSGNINTEQSHTGLHSLQVDAQQLVGACFNLTDQPISEQENSIPYKLKECDCAGRFSPETYLPKDKRYLLSYWRKLDNPTYAPLVNYAQITHGISIANSPVNVLSVKEGKMIDTWQKVDVVFEIPQNASGELVLSFYNDDTSAKAYLDDIRVHPFHATAQTYAYDPSTYRLMAELDENNYATFYEYDAEGILARVKKETPRGIMTLREHRNSLSKN